ncbi:MAG TPA: antitoxin [Phycisphaerae bacterium]|nr:antitoxin [Phycisphaerae bacterium]
MKTTIDLPSELVKELKLRAIHEGKKLKDLAADLLRQGLRSTTSRQTLRPPRVIKDKKTGLPVIVSRPAPPGLDATPERIAEVLLQQEVEWARGSS